jgi:hypothetical protein
MVNFAEMLLVSVLANLVSYAILKLIWFVAKLVISRFRG